MNILAEKQFKENCKDLEITDIFLEQESYLDSLDETMYNDLSNKDKKNIDKMLNDMLFTLEIIYNAIMNDYYISKRFKRIGKFFNMKYGENFRDILGKHYITLTKYVDVFDQAYTLCCLPKEKINTYDVRLAHDLTYLSFITIFNDMAEADFNLLNKNQYKDSDIKDFREVKKTIDSCCTSLKYRNIQKKNEEI